LDGLPPGPRRPLRGRLAGEARALASAARDRFRDRVDLVSYPRSGSTLLRAYLSELQGRPQGSAYRRDVVHPTIRRATSARARGLDRYAFVKSHQLPASFERMVYLVRDGRNATISFLYLTFLAGGHRLSRREELAAGLRLMVRSDPSWGEHARAALRAAAGREVLFVRYEDLIADPGAELLRIAGYLGSDVEEAALEEAVRIASARTGYFETPLGGYTFVPEPGSIYDVLQRHRNEDYWRLLFDAECKRVFHELGGTEPLLRFGYESSEDWWRS
jgi:hypothetical protein